ILARSCEAGQALLPLATKRQRRTRVVKKISEAHRYCEARRSVERDSGFSAGDTGGLNFWWGHINIKRMGRLLQRRTQRAPPRQLELNLWPKHSKLSGASVLG